MNMFHFFQAIFSKVIAVVASGIIAVGIVSVPTTQIATVSQPQIVPQNEIVAQGEESVISPEEIEQTEQKPENAAVPTPAPTLKQTPKVTPPTVIPPAPATALQSATVVTNPSTISNVSKEESKQEIIDYNKTKYIFASYFKILADGRTCASKIDSDMGQIEPARLDCEGDTPAILADGKQKVTFTIQLLNIEHRGLGSKEVSITSENGEINTKIKTNEYGVARFDFFTSIPGNGYITLRVDDGFTRDIKYFASQPVVSSLVSINKCSDSGNQSVTRGQLMLNNDPKNDYVYFLREKNPFGDPSKDYFTNSFAKFSVDTNGRNITVDIPTEIANPKNYIITYKLLYWNVNSADDRRSQDGVEIKSNTLPIKFELPEKYVRNVAFQLFVLYDCPSFTQGVKADNSVVILNF